jgi:hypothetical protein
MTKWTFLLLISCICTQALADAVENDVLSQAGSISEASPNATSSQLDYRICNSGNSDQQALLKINIIGNGTNQVPAGSTILFAQLQIRAQVGGDGQLYRAGESWDSTPTWNEVGDVLTAGTPIGVGLNSGQSGDYDVTAHVQLWANGTSNQGWVIKGFADDCQAAKIYNGSAGDDDKPHLTVVFTPPGGGSDTTPPKVMDVQIGSTLSPHAVYDVPVGSGAQLETVPVGKINQVFVKFSENVNGLTSSKFDFYDTTTQTVYSGTATYNSGTLTATFQLTNPVLVSGKFVLHVYNVISDDAGNHLDGVWNNPTHVDDGTGDTFPSGTGGEGPFSFYLVVMRSDFNHDNIVNSADLTIWQNNHGITSGAAHGEGDANGDGAVDGADFLIWQREFGLDYTSF